jgi:hypothetical protein
LKITIAFLLGAIAGVALFVALRTPPEIAPREDVPSAAIADEEPNLSNQALLQRIAELEAQIDALDAERQAADPATTLPNDAREQTRNANRADTLSASQRKVQQLMEEGFTIERAEWIQRRFDELVAALSSPERLERDPLHQLRMEIGDAEYERYLRATDFDPVVRIAGVENSRAAVFGFQPGDRVTSYDGHRVFDQREIQLREAQGPVGQAVIVEIIRDGQPMQMYVQRGSFNAFFQSYPRLPGR